MNISQLQALTELIMVNDPWPLDVKDHQILTQMADAAAREHGFTDWIDAYHKLDRPTEGDSGGLMKLPVNEAIERMARGLVLVVDDDGLRAFGGHSKLRSAYYARRASGLWTVWLGEDNKPDDLEWAGRNAALLDVYVSKSGSKCQIVDAKQSSRKMNNGPTPGPGKTCSIKPDKISRAELPDKSGYAYRLNKSESAFVLKHDGSIDVYFYLAAISDWEDWSNESPDFVKRFFKSFCKASF